MTKRRPDPEPRPCELCGSVFTPLRRRTALFCSSECAGRYRLGHRAGQVRYCSECQGELVEVNLKALVCGPACRAHRTDRLRSEDTERSARRAEWKAEYQRRYRAENPERFAWSEAGRAAYHRRRAAKAGVDSEKFEPVEIFERDGWVCQICHVKVRKSLVYPDPLSASLDHIVPLSKHGGHTRANTQLAHLRCNVRKRDGAADDQLRLIG